MKPIIIVVIALLSYSVLPSALASDANTPEAYQRQAEQIRAKTETLVPAFALIGQQQPSFTNAWNELLRQQLIVSHGRDTQALSQAIALGLALHYINPFLLRADDSSVDGFFQQQRTLLALAQNDPVLCSVLLNTPSARADQSGRPPLLWQSKYKKLRPHLQSALTQVIMSGNGKQPRELPAEQSRLFMQRIVSQMSANFGPESLNQYELMRNDNASPGARCTGLYQLYETINDQPLELRAQLMRSFFGQ